MAALLLPDTHLSPRQFRTLIRVFAVEGPVNRAAREVGVKRHTAERFPTVLRRAVAQAWEAEARLEGDERDVGGVRTHLRGRAVQGNVVVLGLLKRGGRVDTRPVPTVTRAVLRRIIRQQVLRGSTIYSDGVRRDEGWLTAGSRPYQILHEQTLAHHRRRPITGSENFWGFATTQLRRDDGIRRSHGVLSLKEMECRCNHRHEDVPLLSGRIVKKARPKLDQLQTLYGKQIQPRANSKTPQLP